MERRRYERKIVKLNAERISGNERYAVFIENISENGIYMITAPSGVIMNYVPGTELDIKFQLSSGEILNLHCRVIWSYKRPPPDGSTDNIGMEIIDPPLRYKEFVRTLP
jgi:hypothetical protein